LLEILIDGIGKIYEKALNILKKLDMLREDGVVEIQKVLEKETEFS
jgi:hypothetical protein